MICGIYCLTHVASGKRYIGQSINVQARWAQHRTCREKSVIGAAIAKHGWAAFAAEVLEECPRERLNDAEAAWIEKLGSLSPQGYNLRTGGGQNAEFADEVRQRISEATRRAMTPEMLERRRQAMKGIPKSAEWRAAMSERQRGSENVARLTAMARNQSAETRAKIAAAKFGKPMSETTKQKLSELAKKEGRAQRMLAVSKCPSAETRAKMSASAKARANRQRRADGRFA